MTHHLRLPGFFVNPYGNTNCLCRFAYPPKSLDDYGPRIGIPRYMALHGPHNLCDHRSQSKRCSSVSQYHSRSSATAQTCNTSTLLLDNLLMESVPTWDLYIVAQHLVFTVTICNSHEPLATPSIIARVSILQAWVVVQWCCRFNDSHRWDFPPPISTNFSCCLQRERAISFLLWIILNCEFFLPSQL